MAKSVNSLPMELLRRTVGRSVLLWTAARLRLRQRAAGYRASAGDIPLALFSFNVGVELGQLAFIATVLATTMVAKQLKLTASIEHYALRGAPFLIGSLAAFWFFERLAGFLT